MKIQYKNSKLRKVCEDVSRAAKEYGEPMAEKIHLRIDQIHAADSVEELVQYHIGRCHRLTGQRQKQYAMALVEPYRLVFEKYEDELIAVDVTKEAVEILEIIDYH